MDNLKLINLTSLNESQQKQLLNLWNNEYPAKLFYYHLIDFEKYLNTLSKSTHILLVDSENEIKGWAFSFVRENSRWFAIIISEKIQKKGYGKKLLDRLKFNETELNGWVIDYDSEKRSNGQSYKSPLVFYKKSGFEVLKDKRLEIENISAVKIKWKN